RPSGPGRFWPPALARAGSGAPLQPAPPQYAALDQEIVEGGIDGSPGYESGGSRAFLPAPLADAKAPGGSAAAAILFRQPLAARHRAGLRVCRVRVLR